MSSAIEQTLEALADARKRTDRILVAYSGGKDSVATLDMCLRTFPHVEAFHMEFLPGLRCIDEALADAERQWGVRVHRVQHWSTAHSMNAGLYCRLDYGDPLLPVMSLRDVYALMIADTKIPLVASGMKRCDGMYRASNMGSWEESIWPLAQWKNTDVLAYLARRGLHARLSVKTKGHVSFGVSLHRQCLLWLLDNYPDDFDRMAQVFTYLPAFKKLREIYGDVVALGDEGSTTASPTSAKNQRRHRAA